MMNRLHEMADNRLLAALPDTTCARLAPHLTRTELPLGEHVFAAHQPITRVLFPVVGAGVALVNASQPHNAVVQSACTAYALPASALRMEFANDGALQRQALRFAQALITQISQSALCNRHHSLEQQLSRWLLLMLDRVDGYELSMTQDLIARTLGVRREGVTRAAGALQRDGLIRYRRGLIQILARDALRARVCECYGAVRREYAHLLGAPG